MSMKDEVLELKKELEQVKKETFAMELLKDQRKQNKRQFVVILVILAMWFATIGYLVYVLNDIGVSEEEIIDITDVENIDGSNIQIGDR